MAYEPLVTTGMKCPKPLFETSKRMKTLGAGEVLEIHADDPAFQARYRGVVPENGQHAGRAPPGGNADHRSREEGRVARDSARPNRARKNMANRLLIILTTGAEDRGNRATLAFAMGVASLISGVETTIFMTMGGAFWSRDASCEQVRIDGFDPLSVYVEQYREAGGRVLVCSPCNEFFCSVGRGFALMPGAELHGPDRHRRPGARGHGCQPLGRPPRPDSREMTSPSSVHSPRCSRS